MATKMMMEVKLTILIIASVLINVSSGESNGASDASICLQTLLGVEGCMPAIGDAVVGGQFGNLGSACCGAIIQVTDDCWPALFLPGQDFVPLLLKAACNLLGRAVITVTKLS